MEKHSNSTPEKTKKPLFWGPRISDPSEDLNWEKNRQKILEKHNSPVKKGFFKSDKMGQDSMVESKNGSQKSEPAFSSVIAASPKRITTPIPGNKKPYFSSAQLKAMENQAKLKKTEETSILQKTLNARSSSNSVISTQSGNMNNVTNSQATSELLVLNNSKTPLKVQTLSNFGGTNALKQQSVVRTTQIGNKAKQPGKQQTTQLINHLESVNTIQQPVKLSTQVVGHIQNPVGGSIASQKMQPIKVNATGSVIQQKAVGPVQIQIQQPSVQVAQNRSIPVTVSNVRMQQPVQWPSKLIAVQSVNSQGKIVQQQQQQLQPQGQVQIQNSSKVQGQVQQVIHLAQQQIQVVPEKSGTVQQMTVSQPQTSSGASSSDNDLYITDGKLLIKLDNNFVQQQLSKEKVVALNISDKLDLKKPLLIVKPKTDSNSGVSQQGSGEPTQPSTSQQNVLVFNKPTTIQQTIVPSSVQNFVIPGNYIVKEDSQISSQSGPQTVKIVQQAAPTYIIQQKPVPGKNPQPQIIKIITSQPLGGSNQNLILSPANLTTGTQQIIRPVAQTVVAADQQSKSPTTIRFLRPTHVPPPGSSNIAQGKINALQNSIIVNNLVEIQGQETNTFKQQVIGGKIVSTGVSTVRMATPVQTSGLVSLPSVNVSQGVKLNAQPIKVVVTSCQPFVQKTYLPSGNFNTSAVRSTSVNSVKLATNTQHHQTVLVTAASNLQTTTTTTTTTTVSTMPLKVVSSTQSGTGQGSTVLAHSQPGTLSTTTTTTTTDLAAKTIKVISNAQPFHQVQSQTLVGSSSNVNQTKSTVLSDQPVRVSVVGQSPNVKLIANNNSLEPRIVKNAPTGKTTVITSLSQPLGIVGSSNVRSIPQGGHHPVRIQTVVQSTE